MKMPLEPVTYNRVCLFLRAKCVTVCLCCLLQAIQTQNDMLVQALRVAGDEHTSNFIQSQRVMVQLHIGPPSRLEQAKLLLRYRNQNGPEPQTLESNNHPT
jgi:hypothetical protein